jgi:hypothetical protein
MTKWRRLIGVVAALTAFSLLAPIASADPDDPDASSLQGPAENVVEPLEALDALTAGVISSGPTAKVTKNLGLVGRGVRNQVGVTTDVWAHDGYAYTGTFSTLCSTGSNDSGVWVWNTKNVTKPKLVTVINTAAGSKTNDVKVATMNSGNILVMSNEACAGGPGGFDVYNVDNPKTPQFITRVQTDDVNLLLRDGLGFVDFGVHNLFLFTQGSNDYVAATVESEFGNFQIFDITDPANPTLAGFWGAEQLLFPSVDWVNTTDFGGVILPADAYLFSGFGASANRFLHDQTITADGNYAYLANWDAGLVLLDISDVTNPTLVSVAIDPTSEDGEVNSHSVWPNENGKIVIEGEEDFAPFATVFSITSGPAAGEYPAAEGAITVPIASLPGETMAGPTRYVGGACTPGTAPGFDDPVPAAGGSGEIALIQRGVCTFTEKITNADAAGYDGVVVFNDAARGDALVVMGGSAVNLPGVFVGHSTGLAIAGAASAGDLVIGAAGESIDVSVVPNGWSGMRLWDYSDPTNPVLANTFNTVCSANPVDPSCDPAGTYSSHNVIVETLGTKVLAYIAWYNDGMLILDISDPYNPVEVARYVGSTENSDPNDFWGVYKIPKDPFIYASDRNGGLYILQAKGSGSG